MTSIKFHAIGDHQYHPKELAYQKLTSTFHNPIPGLFRVPDKESHLSAGIDDRQKRETAV